MGSEPQYAKWPLLPLAQHVFTLTNPYASRNGGVSQQLAAKALQDAISEHKMAPFYRYLAHPLEGVLNVIGEGTSSSSAVRKPLSRKSSVVGGMIATRAPSSSVSLPWDEELYQKLKEDNDSELAGIQKEEDDAVENAGDVEVMAARGKRAEFWAKVGDKVSLQRNPPFLPQICSLTLYTLYRRKPSLLMKTCSKRPLSSAQRSTWCSL
jgi:26S proteasome regulatory subunit N7